MATLLTSVGTFLSSIFGSIGTVLTSSASNELLALFMLVIPISGIAIKYMFRIIGKRRGRR